METVDSILRFWLGTATDDLEVAGQCGKLWWKKDAETDALIRQRFSGVLDDAVNARCEDWLKEARGRLAMIILTDQFSRNMFRGSPLSFAYDALALALAQEAISIGADTQLSPIERNFLYMPFMHSESLEIHDLAMELFRNNGLEGNLEYEIKHREIIEKFGRYPHRNAILGRESTLEEIAFLKQPGSSF